MLPNVTEISVLQSGSACLARLQDWVGHEWLGRIMTLSKVIALHASQALVRPSVKGDWISS